MLLVAQCALLLSALHAVQSTCPGKPWKLWGAHCYRLTTRPVLWHGLRAECKSMFRRAEVANITSSGEQSFIHRTFAKDRSVWLGMRSHGNKLSCPVRGRAAYTNFNTSIARVPGTGEVVRMTEGSGIWELVSSYDYFNQHFGVCKMARCKCPRGWRLWGKHCHKVVVKTLGWVEARQHCQSLSLGADLVSIHSTKDNEFLTALTRRHSPAWIGLNDRQQEGVYRWSGNNQLHQLATGTPCTHWHKGQPNGHRHDQDCVALYKDKTWEDGRCNTSITAKSFICQVHVCGGNKVIPKERTSIGPARIWRPEDGVRCPIDWSRSGLKCFKGLSMLSSLSDYSTTRDRCYTAAKGIIPTIDSLTDNDMARLVSQMLPVWIRPGKQFTNWMPEPTEGGGDCTSLQFTGEWKKERCKEERAGLCQVPACVPECPSGWSLFEGHCYSVKDTKANAHDAQIVCSDAGGHLASIHSQDENDFIQTLAFPYMSSSELNKNESNQLVWIGASRILYIDDWSWKDCTKWTISRWVGTDEPNPSSEDRCALMNMAGRWKGSTECEEEMPVRKRDTSSHNFAGFTPQNLFRFVCKLDPCVEQFGSVDGSGCGGKKANLDFPKQG